MHLFSSVIDIIYTGIYVWMTVQILSKQKNTIGDMAK